MNRFYDGEGSELPIRRSVIDMKAAFLIFNGMTALDFIGVYAA